LIGTVVPRILYFDRLFMGVPAQATQLAEQQPP
jgi:hypothetical protein